MSLLPRAINRAIIPLLLAALVALAALFLWPRGSGDKGEPTQRVELGLMTGLPIYWVDGADISALLDENAELPWVRQVLEQRYELRPVDSFVAEEGEDGTPLDGLERLLIVQPRGISPAGNVALDDWVQGGGRLLYVIDPMLTGEYAVPLGDPRHPSVIGIVPPVLPRWGVTMEARAETSDAGPQFIETPVGPLPVATAGRLTQSDNGIGNCTIEASGLIARCKVGAGQVTVLADAALFEARDGTEQEVDIILELADYALR